MAIFRKFAKKGRRAVKKSTKPYASKPVIRRAIGVAKSRAFSKAVKSVMSKTEETKMIQLPMEQVPLSDYATGAYQEGALTCYVRSIFPNAGTLSINQGVGQKNRIANKIRTHKCVLRGIITPRIFYQDATQFYPKNTDCKPCLVKMWILTQKNQAYGQVEPDMPDFLQNGNLALPLDGTIMDTFRKVNTDLYHIYATRTFKVGNSWYSKNTSDGFNYLAGQYSANNDFKLCQRFTIDLTKFCIKHVTYNDGDNLPKVRGLWMAWEAIAADGSQLETDSYPIQLSYELDYEFKDV
jgi:hypothetical protein